MQERICYIVGAMPLEEELLPRLCEGDLLIAADKGYERLTALGMTPHLVVGDFDSLDRVPEHPQLLRLPRIKDETDMGFALNRGLERGFRRFVLLGGMGGRLDHSLANLQLLSYLSNRGARGVLAGNGQAACAITNAGLSFPSGLEGRCSVFCQSGLARGVSLEGLKYPLEEAELEEHFPLGVSNEFLGLPANISVREGTLLVIWETRGRLWEMLPQIWL